MRQKLPLLLLAALLFITARAQVSTNFNNNQPILSEGRFGKPYKATVHFEIAAKDINALLENEKKEAAAKAGEGQPFKLAVPVPIDLNIAKDADWTEDGKYAYGKYTINANGALSASINFDDFFLPEGTELYVYNEGGNMITGPVTEVENNPNRIWGSWVYKGGMLTVEVKTPTATKGQLVLHANNIAYGYKKIYETQVANFGASVACHINVLCALGNGWENERNGVALILDGSGAALCSGSMIMNTCNTNRPFFLTANHCFAASTNVSAWRFTFQAWSPTCTPSQNSNGVTFNGSTLRANSANTDFCLVELSTTPGAGSGISYNGWSRNTTGITQTTLIHHPRGDVMKITRDDQAPGTAAFLGANCWALVTDQGTTEGGSSGCPYFDQNHRIIGQHFGINDGNLAVCQQVNKFGGRFDLSWAGDGTNATRLSNWLDPSGSNAMTTNTNGIANLIGTLTINGPASICNSPTTYTLSGAPAGSTITWSASGGVGSISGTGSSATFTPSGRGNATITATVGCTSVSRTISVNAPVGITSSMQGGCNGAFQTWQLSASPTANGSSWSWTVSFLGTNSQINIYSPSSPSTQVGVKGGGTVRLNYTDACGVARQDGVTVYSTCPQFRVSVLPNPVKNNLTVQLDEPIEGAVTSETSPASPLRSIRSKDKTILTLLEMNTNLPVKQWQFNEVKNKRYSVPLQGLRKGIYLLQVDRNNESRITKLYVE